MGSWSTCSLFYVLWRRQPGGSGRFGAQGWLEATHWRADFGRGRLFVSQIEIIWRAVEEDVPQLKVMISRVLLETDPQFPDNHSNQA